ncbi:hypothetical protein HNQ59_003230 [Chitinivorax tropicus]|uniref:Uncharacterized protein n=1 Tax=Chitinivorax tropicus TaxID=714531 RepID=A0A840MT18_9PROT|nr:hypothetical protein [Chitinivorax tropicus]MBB5019922.1 hypothetical protein [Chitinivorax tropicus]
MALAYRFLGVPGWRGVGGFVSVLFTLCAPTTKNLLLALRPGFSPITPT